MADFNSQVYLNFWENPFTREVSLGKFCHLFHQTHMDEKADKIFNLTHTCGLQNWRPFLLLFFDQMPTLSSMKNSKHLAQGEDFYLNEEGLMVFTEHYHLKRGHCCKSGCRHCPYGKIIDPNTPSELIDSWSSGNEIEFYDGEIDEEYQ